MGRDVSFQRRTGLTWNAPAAITATMLVTVVAVSAVAARASEPTGQTTTVSDSRRDVRLFNTPGLTVKQRQSIDLHSVEIRSQTGIAKLIYVVRLKQIIDKADWDQMVFIVLSPASGSTATWTANAGVTSKGAGYAFLASDSDYTTMENCRADVDINRRRAQITIHIPYRCVPLGPARIQVRSSTGYFESDAPLFSLDKLKVASSLVLAN